MSQALEYNNFLKVIKYRIKKVKILKQIKNNYRHD